MTKLIEVTSERYLRRLSKEINTRIAQGQSLYYGESKIRDAKYTRIGKLQVQPVHTEAFSVYIYVTNLKLLCDGYGTQIVASREA